MEVLPCPLQGSRAWLQVFPAPAAILSDPFSDTASVSTSAHWVLHPLCALDKPLAKPADGERCKNWHLLLLFPTGIHHQ